MVYGKDPKRLRLLEKRKEKGFPTPALDDRPELFDDLAEVWAMFRDLDRSRQSSGMAPQAIAVRDIAAILDIYDVRDPEERIETMRLIQDLDEVMMRHHIDSVERERETQSNGNAQAGDRRTRAQARGRGGKARARGAEA